MTAPTPAVEPVDNPEQHRQIRVTITVTELPDGDAQTDIYTEHRLGAEPSVLEVLGALESAKLTIHVSSGGAR